MTLMPTLCPRCFYVFKDEEKQELLEALEAAKAYMENPYPAGDDLSHVLVRAGAAIAKATGEK